MPSLPPECLPPNDPNVMKTWRPPGYCGGPRGGPGGPGGPGEICTPDKPCKPPAPPGCSEGADGTMTCAPPTGCEGKSDGHCAPPPWCKPTDGGQFSCDPKAAPKPHHAGPGAPPCAPEGAPAPGPCGPGAHPPPMGPPPGCNVEADGHVTCPPPPGCGGAAFAGAGVEGCAPPTFCDVTSEGNYKCAPPKECIRNPDGSERCFEAPKGGNACVQFQSKGVGVQAEGRFAACAERPPEQFCPPPKPGEDPSERRCRAPPPPPRPCAPGEEPFPPSHPAGTPPVCMPFGKVENGEYRPPAAFNAEGCVPPPPPPTPLDPAVKYCAVAHFAPPPVSREEFAAWKEYAKEKMPREAQAHFDAAAQGWEQLDDKEREELHKLAVARGMFAQPAFDGRVVDSAFMGATTNPQDLAVSGYAVGGVSFIKDAKPASKDSSQIATTVGGAVILAGNNTIVEMHNTASGQLIYRAAENPYQVNLSLDPNLRVERRGDLVILANGTWKAAITAESVQVKADGSVELTVNPREPAIFMAIPPTPLENETRLHIAEGVAKGKMGAEALITATNGTVAPAIVNYANVNVTVADTDPDALTVDVESAEHDGKVVVLTVDRDTLTVPLAEFSVTIDNKTLAPLATMGEILDYASNYTTPPEAELNASDGAFYLTATEDTVRVAVFVPGFSQHRVVIGSATKLVTERVAASSTYEFTEVEASTDEPEVEDAAADGDDSGAPSDSGAGTDAGASNSPPATAAKEAPGFGLALAVAGVAAALLLAGPRGGKPRDDASAGRTVKRPPLGP